MNSENQIPSSSSENLPRQVVNPELVERLIDCIDHLCLVSNYVSWQDSYSWFGYQCWYYVCNPASIPNTETHLLGVDYDVERARQNVEEMTELSKEINGWVVYDLPSGPRYIASDEWNRMYDKNCVQLKLPGIYRLSSE